MSIGIRGALSIAGRAYPEPLRFFLDQATTPSCSGRPSRYPTDLTDEDWLFIQSFLSAVPKRGRKPKTDRREVFDALRYLARIGGGCRLRQARMQ